MTRRQFALTLVVVAVAGLLGGALSDWLRGGQVNAQGERDGGGASVRSVPVTIGGGEVQTEEGWGGGLRDSYRLKRGVLNDGRVPRAQGAAEADVVVADEADVIVARELQLVDSDGNVRAALRMHGDTPCLSMVDSDPQRAPKLWLCRDLSVAGQRGRSAGDPGQAWLGIQTAVPVDVLPAPPKAGTPPLMAGDLGVYWQIRTSGKPGVATP